MHHGRTPPWPILILLGFVVALLSTPLVMKPSTVTGQVADGMEPVEGALVRFPGKPLSTLTDAAGRFHLARRGQIGDRITAWSEGYFIAGINARTDPLNLQLRPLPVADCERYSWVDPSPNPARPGNCGNCHGEIHREWSQSGHARSATGRHFRDLLDSSDGHGLPNRGWSLLAEHPDGAGVCTACHAPTVAFDDPAYFDLRKAKGVGALGVHCDYCHKISGIAGEVGLTHGRFGLKLTRPSEGQLFFGPLDDVDRCEDAYLPLYRQSRYCAPCHEGTVFGVHVYSTYSEWLDSPARRQGRQCQSCHMTPTGRMHNIAPGHGGIERDPGTLGNHRFVAGSRDAMLRDSVYLRLNGRRSGNGVEVDVIVEARNVGHRVPTGFVDRHLVLTVEASSGNGDRVEASSGPRLLALAGKDYQGQSGKLYAKLLKDFEGHSPVPFWRADSAVTDTRLTPGQPDHLSFQFPPGARHIQARLIYRRFWPEVAASKGWSDPDVVVKTETRFIP